MYQKFNDYVIHRIEKEKFGYVETHSPNLAMKDSNMGITNSDYFFNTMLNCDSHIM